MTLAALLAALGRPAWWLLALAGFLVRGGVLLFVLAIVSLPSPLVVSNIVAPLVVPLVLGRIDAGTLALVGLAVGLVAAWLIGGGWAAAATEIALIRDAPEAMVDEGLESRPPARPGGLLTTRVMAAHLLAHVPTALALAIGSVRIANVAYLELTSPFEVATPLLLRIIGGAAAPLGAILVVWVLGEIVGGVAVRRIVLDGASLFGGLRGAVADLVRRPAATALPAVATLLVLAVDLAALLGAIAFVWSQVRERVLDTLTGGPALVIGLLALGGTWVGALALTGLIDAWRSAAMTF
ncbi:MAG TPA: hypothetical protein VFY18_13795, partial [Candidatus Limnocylindrales bacterium]|nr:hypothetical protein [Candidatus Limnocylindrales bacterium]